QERLFDPAFDRFFLSFAELEFFKGLYAPAGADFSDPRLSPLEAESFEGLPPAVIVVGQCDPIHPQGEAVHERLREAGVSSTLLVYPGMIHGFYGMTSLFEQAVTAFEETGAALDAILGSAASAAGAVA